MQKLSETRVMEVVAALAGAVVGALAGYFLNAKVWEPQRVREKRSRLAAALLAEAKAWKELYWQVFGEYLETLEPGKPLGSMMLVTHQNLLVVYDNNAGDIGLFPQADIQLIVRTATLTKGYLETLNQQHDEISRWTDLIHESSRAGMPEAAKNAKRFRDEARVAAADTLRKQSRGMLQALDAAIEALGKYT